MRMAPDNVSAALQIARLAAIQKRRRSQQAGGDEKMALPATTIQFLCSGESPFAAIVKRNQHVLIKLFKINVLDGAGGGSAVSDPFEVLGKYRLALLVRHGRSPLEPGRGRVVGDVVIKKCGDLCWRFQVGVSN